MYSAQPNGADSATINPAALASPDLLNSNSRGVKRSRSPDTYEAPPPGSAGDDESPTQASAPMQQSIPPQTPQSQNARLPGPQPGYTPSQASASSPPKPTPTKSTLKALPTVRDHTTDQLGPGGDEYLPREIDENGEKKVMPNGQLLGGREYRCRTFLVPNRGDKLFMLATECARVLGYRDSYLLFNKNRSLFKIIANQTEKDDLVSQEILPFSYRSRQIAIVTARSMFRQFGSRVIVNGRRVRDDYWETKARKQGFTEADLAGEKRPGASKAREAAAAAEQNASLLGGPQGEIVYSNSPAQFGGAPHPQLIQPVASHDHGWAVAAAFRGGSEPKSPADDDSAAVFQPDSSSKLYSDNERYGPSSKSTAFQANKYVLRVYSQHATNCSRLWLPTFKPDVATHATDSAIRVYSHPATAAIPSPPTELYVSNAAPEQLWPSAASRHALLRYARSDTRLCCPVTI
ncbi:Chromatin structure-remodeling complex subunit rsc7 [Cytospora mali]|uniref:Chromatin structure-remodeling complex subunit rsc7 n=1 Tax=Cytospora mali TaxID=578113 RepID=A0A194VQI6_CYTMA|nr:Chromatin structure-remodeling complex subunit rsc7 [Valsa mali]